MRLNTTIYRKIVATLILLLLFGTNIQAQDMKARVDSTKILIGSQTLFTVEVILKDGQKVRFPNLPDTLAPGLEVVSQYMPETSKVDKERMLITKRYMLTSFDSGSYVVPRIPILFYNGARVDTLLTQSFKLDVNTVAVDSTKTPLYGIKANIKAPYTFWEIALAILVVLLFIGLVVGIIRYFRRSKDEPIFTFKKKVVEPAHVIAFRELDELLQQKLWQEGHTKRYYSELTDILRRYLDNRMEINAMEMTSFEILAALKAHGYANKAIYERIMVMLNTSDLVKFAKHNADPIENDQAAKCIYDFIDDTKELVTPVVDQKEISTESAAPSSSENN